MSAVEFDFDAYYRVAGYGGVAWHAWEYEKTRDSEYEWTGIENENRERVRCTMVGDDRSFVFDIDELEVLAREDFCGVCGQIGCSHDGYERE